MDNNSLAHTKWECKYHIVFAPKYRRQVIYKDIKADVGQILGTLCSYTYVGTNPTQIFRIRNSRVSEREKFAYDIRKTIFTFISELCFGYKGPGCSQFVNGLVLFQRKSV